MKKIKILYLITGLNIGGAEIVLRDIVQEINADRFQIVVVSLISTGQIGRELRENGFIVLSLDVKMKYDPRLLIRFLLLLKRERPDILHTHLFHANVLGRIIGKIAGVPIIISTIHNEYFGGRLRELLLMWTRGLCDMTTVVSKKVSIRMMKLHIVTEKTCRVIHNGILLNSFPLILPHEREKHRLQRNLNLFHPVFVCIGRLTKQKGYEFLLQTIFILKQRIPNLKLLIVGEGEERLSLEKKIKELQIQDQVELVGSQSIVRDFLAVADIFLLPSIFEGFGIVILEAMACGIPVIASNVGAVNEIIQCEHSGFIVEPNDEYAFMKEIEKVLSLSQEEKIKVVSAARNVVENKFSIEKIAEEYQQLYEELLKKNKI